MPAKRELTMRQLRYLLRLHHDGVSAREIGRLLGVARSTIQDNLKRAAAAELQWPLPEEATDEVLELRLFGRSGVAPGRRWRVEPDWAVQRAHWTCSHIRMFRFFGGAPRLLVPDNLKSGFNKAVLYAPEINRTY